MPGTHATLSASSAARWLHCPPSARLAEQFPDTGSKYAAAGTLAHAIAELKARKYFLEPMSARSFNAKMKKFKEDPSYDPGMEAATDAYLEHLKELALTFEQPPFVALEVRVNFSGVAPEGFGTADCVMIGGGTMHIVDYKNGAGVAVEAEENPQMMLYAIGAMTTFYPIFGDSIQTVCLHIVQPHAGGVKSWQLTREELDDFGLEARGPAKLAYDGEGDFNPGPWCDDHFCPARATCMARTKKLLELENVSGQDPDLISDNTLGVFLTRAIQLQKWVSALQDHAFKKLMEGKAIPGWKLVEGRISREWGDQEMAFKEIQQAGVPEAMLWERKPVSVAALEKALGKKAFEEAAGGWVVKRPGKPTMVPDSDKRPAYVPAAAAFSEVADA